MCMARVAPHDRTDETPVTLVADMANRLGAIASEFGERAARLTLTASATRPLSPEAVAAAAASLIENRRLRRRHLPRDLFGEPGWDMLLALAAVYPRGTSLNVKMLVAASGAPATTAQRWIDQLARLDLIVRRVDEHDRRCVDVHLSDGGWQAIAAYINAVH
jgi:DNA-binding MarR family transcriptional regulator